MFCNLHELFSSPAAPPAPPGPAVPRYHGGRGRGWGRARWGDRGRLSFILIILCTRLKAGEKINYTFFVLKKNVSMSWAERRRG